MALMALIPCAASCSLSNPTGSATRTYAEVVTYEDHVLRMEAAELQSGQLAYLDEGSGPVVVLMHGIPTSSWMYRKVVRGLVEQGHRVIAPDLMGMGASERIEDEDLLSVKAQADVLLELLGDHLGLRDWTHVVHDFAGPITWEMLGDERFRATRLVLLNTFAFEDGWSPGLNGITKAATAMGTSPPFDRAFYEIAVKGMVKDSGVANARMLHGYCRPLVEGADVAYRCLYFEANDLKGRLAGYQSKLEDSGLEVAGIVWGRHDEFLSAGAQLEQLQALMNVPASRVRIVEGAGHLIAEEDPGAVIAAISGEPQER